MNTIARGMEAELSVAKELTKYGLVVCTPLSHASQYDLIVDTKLGLQRIQVKRAYKVNNHGYEQMCVETRRILVKHSGKRGAVSRGYEKGAFDFLIAVDCENDDFWIIPFEMAYMSKAQLYLKTKKLEEYKNQWSVLGVDVSS